MAKNIYILDTCVLLHDPNCIFKFKEHDIYIPLAVIDDLDDQKTRPGSIGWAAREVFRILEKYDVQKMSTGIKINEYNGRLFVYNFKKSDIIDIKKSEDSDNSIIESSLQLKKEFPKRKVIIVTKDHGLRIRATGFNCESENYKSGQTDADIFIGYQNIDITDLNLWNALWKDDSIKVSELKTKFNIDIEEINPNEFLVFKNGEQKCIAINKKGTLKVFKDKDKPRYSGVTPKNLEQRMAIELLTDESIPLVCLSGPAGSGKSLALDSLILTENGWITMGEITLNDKVAGSDGKFHNVTGIFPQGKKEVVKVIFSDGAEVECCKEHLWSTKNEYERDEHKPYTVKDTASIMESLLGHDDRKNHSIPVVEPIEFNKKDLKIDPYVLGVILGDGGISKGSVIVSTKDDEILNLLKLKLSSNFSLNKVKNSNCDYRIADKTQQGNELISYLRELNLMGTKSNSKFIPEIYKLSSIEDRIELLKGLLDTDGYISKKSAIYYYTVSKRLCNDIVELIRSIGGIAKVTIKFPKYTYNGIKKDGQDCYVVCISLPNNIVPFNLTRKQQLVKPRTKYFPTRFIVDMIESGEKECQCISVDSGDNLYVTNDYILTHNTICALAVGLDGVQKGLYEKIIVMKPLIAVGGKEIGFLPGDKFEKISAWLGPIKDNIIQLANSHKSDSFEDLCDKGIIEVEAMAFIQGRSIANSFILLDEAENISPKEARMVVERAGANSKIVFLGDLSQIENPFLDARSCGLSHAINGGKVHELAGSVALSKVERSSLSAAASIIFNRK